jgi:hypothetical protein
MDKDQALEFINLYINNMMVNGSIIKSMVLENIKISPINNNI